MPVEKDMGYRGRIKEEWWLSTGLSLYIFLQLISVLCAVSHALLQQWLLEYENHSSEIHLYIHIFAQPFWVYCFSGCSIPHQHGTHDLWLGVSPYYAAYVQHFIPTLSESPCLQFKLWRKIEKNPQETVKVTNDHVLDDIFQAYKSQ